jgi:hypothetical protein
LNCVCICVCVVLRTHSVVPRSVAWLRQDCDRLHTCMAARLHASVIQALFPTIIATSSTFQHVIAPSMDTLMCGNGFWGGVGGVCGGVQIGFGETRVVGTCYCPAHFVDILPPLYRKFPVRWRHVALRVHLRVCGFAHSQCGPKV